MLVNILLEIRNPFSISFFKTFQSLRKVKHLTWFTGVQTSMLLLTPWAIAWAGLISKFGIEMLGMCGHVICGHVAFKIFEWFSSGNQGSRSQRRVKIASQAQLILNHHWNCRTLWTCLNAPANFCNLYYPFQGVRYAANDQNYNLSKIFQTK